MDPGIVDSGGRLSPAWRMGGTRAGGFARARLLRTSREGTDSFFFKSLPFHFPIEDQEFLLAQQWTELRLHKNVSYRPSEDVLRGVSGDARTIERIHTIMRNYSAQVIEFLTKFLAPYATKWNLDFSQFSPTRGRGAGSSHPQTKRSTACGCVSEPADAWRQNFAGFHESQPQAPARLEHDGRI